MKDKMKNLFKDIGKYLDLLNFNRKICLKYNLNKFKKLKTDIMKYQINVKTIDGTQN